MIFSFFPQLLFLAPFSALLIRISIALILVFCAWKHVTSDTPLRRILGFVELLAGVFIAVGAWTQVVAIVVFCVGLIWLAFPSTRALPVSTILLTTVLSISLVITGAGLLAFDLPL